MGDNPTRVDAQRAGVRVRCALPVRPARDEQGVVAILVALSMMALLVSAGMVLDFGLIRIDRQIDKSAADAAAIAGLHALNGGDARTRPFVGVCTAVRYLQVNGDRFAHSDNGTWTTGAGVAVGDGCTSLALRNQVCTPGMPATWAKYTWTGTWAGAPLTVTVQSGYQLSGSRWAEDGLVAAQADAEDRAQGCNQLAVLITQSRKPGLGSLATDGDLVSAVRSVGRVAVGTGGYAPALLLLKRTGCPVLQSGAAGGGSFIHVRGAMSTNGLTQPGTIHSDSDGEGGCTGGSNQNVFLGKGSAGIVAYAAPQAINPLMPDPSKPGQITSVAGANSKALNYVRDLLANVYSSAALNEATAGSATKTDPIGRNLITRGPVDDRYLAGVRTAIGQANAVFTTVNPLTAITQGFIKLVGCKPSQLTLNLLNLTAASRLYIDCTTNAGFVGDGTDLTINAGTVIFNGAVAPGATLSLPNASKVYINGTGSDSLVLGGAGSKFRMHTSGNTDPVTGRCSSQRSSSRAVLFVQAGDVKESSSTNLLQLCKTTVFMMGGRTDGCLPTYTDVAPAPSGTPCGGGLGTGQFTQNGGDIDWTAPDQYDVTTLSNGLPDPALAAAWSDPTGPEDLALWSESGTNQSSTYNMSGGGVFNVRGVYMVPNAEPFTIGGGGTMNLGNAQFIASSIALNGNTTNITMSVDPNAAINLPKISIVGLVR